MGNHHSVKRECLHEAIRRKDVKKIKQIIYNNDEDFIKNDFKSLELATVYNLTDVVELLLTRGCVPRDKQTARAFDLGALLLSRTIERIALSFSRVEMPQRYCHNVPQSWNRIQGSKSIQ